MDKESLHEEWWEHKWSGKKNAMGPGMVEVKLLNISAYRNNTSGDMHANTITYIYVDT